MHNVNVWHKLTRKKITIRIIPPLMEQNRGRDHSPRTIATTTPTKIAWFLRLRPLYHNIWRFLSRACVHGTWCHTTTKAAPRGQLWNTARHLLELVIHALQDEVEMISWEVHIYLMRMLKLCDLWCFSSTSFLSFFYCCLSCKIFNSESSIVFTSTDHMLWFAWF